jgi:uncharacterized protein
VLFLGGLWLILPFVLAAVPEWFIFHPEPLPQGHVFRFEQPFEEVWLEPESNARIHGLWFRQEQPQGLILYFHGNAGSLDRWGQYAADFTRLGYEVMMIDYRTFGKSTGPLSEGALHRDAFSAYRFARQHFKAEEIVLYGRSLGSGIATQLAAAVPARMLILETPFFNLRDVMQSYLPLMGRGAFPHAYGFRSDLFIQQVEIPIHIFHGTRDGVVPYREGYRFQELLQDRVDFLTLPGGGHHDLAQFPAYLFGLVWPGSLLHLDNGLAILLKCSTQIGGDQGSGATFDVMALNHVYQCAVFKEGNGGRRRRIRKQVLSCSFSSFHVHTGKYRNDFRRLFLALKRSNYTRTGSTGSTTADRVYHEQGCTFLLLKDFVNFSGSVQGLNASVFQFRSHGGGEFGRISHRYDIKI